MQKKTMLSVLSLTLIGVATSCIVINYSKDNRYDAQGAETIYTIRLANLYNSPEIGDEFLSGSEMAETSTGRTLIEIEYNKARNYGSYLVSLDVNGSILNPYTNEVYDEYHNAISGIKNITVNFDGVKNLDLYYGWESELKDGKYANLMPIYSGITYDLDNVGPSYFKILNTNSSFANINEVIINYSCVATKNTESFSEGLDFEEITYDGQPAVMVRKYHGESENVYIPDTYLGLPVKVIGDSAFISNEFIKNVCLPASIEEIQESAFYECFNLESISYPDGLKTIGDFAFRDCHNLMEPHFPKSLTSIGRYAYQNCYILGTIFLGKHITTIAPYAFIQNKEDSRFFYTDAPSRLLGWSDSFIDNLNRINYNMGKLIYSKDDLVYNVFYTPDGPVAKVVRNTIVTPQHDDIIIPETIPFEGENIPVVEIAPYGLRTKGYTTMSVVLPKNVKTLGACAFHHSLIESLNIENVEYIGAACFYECKNLNKLYIGKNCKYIGPNAFNLTGAFAPGGSILYIYFTEQPETWDKKWDEYNDIETKFWGFGGFYEDENYSYILINKGTNLSPNMVAYITKYKGHEPRVVVPNKAVINGEEHKIVKVDSGAFSYNSQLLSVSFQKGGVTALGTNVFYNCPNLSKIYLDGITSLGASSLAHLNSLVELDIPKSVEYIGQYAINYCDNLKTITGMHGLKEIDECGISSNRSLVTLKIPRSLERVKRCAFFQNVNLKDIYLPNSINYIEGQICGGCNRDLLMIHLEPGYDPYNNALDIFEEWNEDRRGTYFEYKCDYDVNAK